MVIDSGGDYTFWQVRVRFEEPSFTGLQHQQHFNWHSLQLRGSDKPYIAGGGLGVPGSKARVMQLLDQAGYSDVYRITEVCACCVQCAQCSAGALCHRDTSLHGLSAPGVFSVYGMRACLYAHGHHPNRHSTSLKLTRSGPH